CPPFGFDKIIVICYIWMFHICPETNCSGEIFPHSFIFPDTLFTFVDERDESVLFDLFFSVQTKKLLYLEFYRKTMGIPSCLSRHHFSFHRLVSRDHIFDDTCQYVSDMRFSICSRRSVIECVRLTLFPVL